MEKFSTVSKGYNPVEVNLFLDEVISKVENMITALKKKDEKIKELEEIALESRTYKGRIEQYERMEESLNKAIMMAQKTSEQIKLSAHQEAESIVNEAKNNANRIVNESLLKSEKIDSETEMAKRNLTIFKRRLKGIVEGQLEVIEDIEKIEI